MIADLQILRPISPSGAGDCPVNVDNVAVIGIEPADSQDPAIPGEVAICLPTGFARSWFVLWHEREPNKEFGPDASLLARYVHERAISPGLVVQNLEAAAQGYLLYSADPVCTAWRLKHLYERAGRPGQAPAIGDLGSLMAEQEGGTGRSVAAALNLHRPFDRAATEVHLLSQALQSVVGIRRVSKR
jgi:hypothetical protein